jgi:hypothetical protein
MERSVRDDSRAEDADTPLSQSIRHHVKSSPYLELEHPFTVWCDGMIFYRAVFLAVYAKGNFSRESPALLPVLTVG